MAEQIRLEVWVDYSCPYAYRAAVWLSWVKRIYGDKLTLEWHSFPLEQVNSIQGAEWKLWEQPDDYRSRGLWAFRAAEAAKAQGPEAFERFHMALFQARHEERRDISDRAVLADLAREAGLDANRFQQDLADRSLMARIGEDYEQGVQQHGIWGTPTLVFNGRSAAYLKLQSAPPADDAVSFFDDLVQMVDRRPYVVEVKRPR
jgi:predicted DsbA family dithiol-disulfide isomerase